VHRWDGASGELLQTSDVGLAPVLDFATSGSVLYGGAADGFVYTWTAGMQLSGTVMRASSQPGSILALSVSEDGELLSAGTLEGELSVFDCLEARLVGAADMGDAVVGCGIGVGAGGACFVCTKSGVQLWNLKRMLDVLAASTRDSVARARSSASKNYGNPQRFSASGAAGGAKGGLRHPAGASDAPQINSTAILSRQLQQLRAEAFDAGAEEASAAADTAAFSTDLAREECKFTGLVRLDAALPRVATPSVPKQIGQRWLQSLDMQPDVMVLCNDDCVAEYLDPPPPCDGQAADFDAGQELAFAFGELGRRAGQFAM